LVLIFNSNLSYYKTDLKWKQETYSATLVDNRSINVLEH